MLKHNKEMNQYRKSRKLSPQYREHFEMEENYDEGVGYYTGYHGEHPQGYEGYEEDYYYANYPSWGYNMWESFQENYPHPRLQPSEMNIPCDWKNYVVGAPPGSRCCAGQGPIHRQWRNDLPCPNYFGSMQNVPFRHLPPNYKVTKDGVVIRFRDKGFRKGKLMGVA